MGEVKARVDALVEKLRDLSPEVRLEAIEELGTVDKEHALPALHWAIQNEVDESVRNVARDAYQKLSRLAYEESKEKASESAGDKTRDANHPKVKAVVLEEGVVNPLGRSSLYIGVGVIAALVLEFILRSGQDPRNVPALFLYWRVGVGAVSVPGLALGILGIMRHGARHLTSIAGTAINGLVVVIYFLKVVLALF